MLVFFFFLVSTTSCPCGAPSVWGGGCVWGWCASVLGPKDKVNMLVLVCGSHVSRNWQSKWLFCCKSSCWVHPWSVVATTFRLVCCVGNSHATSHPHGMGMGACLFMVNMHETHMHHMFWQQKFRWWGPDLQACHLLGAASWHVTHKRTHLNCYGHVVHGNSSSSSPSMSLTTMSSLNSTQNSVAGSFCPPQ